MLSSRRLCVSCLNLQAIRYVSTALVHSSAGLPDGLSSKKSSRKSNKSKADSETRRISRAKTVLEGPSLLDSTKLEDYLDKLAASRNVVTLADIERLRPIEFSPPGTPQYAEEYTQLLDNITRSFSHKQLQEFVKLYNLKSPVPRKKPFFAMAIVEQQWGWPSLSEIEKKARDWSTSSVKTYPLTVEQAFLILGKDGADLLAMSMQYNVHITFCPYPMSLKVEGLLGALNQLTEHIVKVKSDISEEILVLPTKRSVTSDLLHRISRLSGALTQDLGSGKIRISYKQSDPRSMSVAKRLATRASCEVSDADELIKTPTLTHVPPGVPTATPVPLSIFPHTYSLYPFFPSRPLSWTLRTGSVFRLRRVGEWFGINTREDVMKTGGLALGRGVVLNLAENPESIQNVLLEGLSRDPSIDQPSNGKRIRAVTATTGHLLVAPLSSPKPTLTSPLKSSWPLSKILKWMREHSARTVFQSSVPLSVLSSPSGEQWVLHRVIYQALPESDGSPRYTKAIKFEMVLSSPTSTAKSNPENETGGNSVQLGQLGDNRAVESSTGEPDLDLPLVHTCWAGKETSVNLMMPNRPMDIQFSAFDASVLPDAERPPELESYAASLRTFLQFADSEATQPDAPLLLRYQGEEYVLHSSSSVRQNHGILDGLHKPPVKIVSESILDLEGNQKSAICQLSCTEMENEEHWKSFLEGCDYISTVSAQPAQPSPLFGDLLGIPE